MSSCFCAEVKCHGSLYRSDTVASHILSLPCAMQVVFIFQLCVSPPLEKEFQLYWTGLDRPQSQSEQGEYQNYPNYQGQSPVT
jgi:hypothetical protein